MNTSPVANEAAVLDQCGHYFREHGFAVLRGVLGASEAELCANYALIQTATPDYFRFEEGFGSQGRYADALTECLLLRMLPIMERVSGGPLFPCYSFLRIYQAGAELRRHVDRASCEISTSLTLGMDSPRPWPLCLESRGKPVAVNLAPGDMLLYRGVELPHWRDRFEGTHWVQVFLHYVHADGPFAKCRFDGREGIGPFDPARQRRLFDPSQVAGEKADAPGA